jgi:hypothetical protein
MKNFNHILWIFIFLSCAAVTGFSQEERPDNGSTDYRVEIFGSAASKDLTPFHIVSNRYGRVPLRAGNGFVQAGVFHRYQSKGLHSEAGVDLVTVTPRDRKAYVEQVYVAVGYKWLHLTVGSKEHTVSLWDGELSSGDLVHSSNARPIPEVNVSIPRFTTLPRSKGLLHIKGNFAVGRSFDEKFLAPFNNGKQYYLKHVLWHHKSVFLRLLDTRHHFPLTATVGFRHPAQWGGTSTSPAEGTQPHSLKDFLRVVMGRSGGKDASLISQQNVLGNHYGSYDFKIGYLSPLFDLQVYRQHFFDDASGMEFHNAPDGLYGIQANVHHFMFVQKVVLEYLYTRNQSGPFHYIVYDHSEYPGFGGGNDNYYNNEEYTTGISYFNRSIGSPLITSPEYNRNGRLGFRNNRVRAWHIGLSGYLSGQVAYRILLTHAEGWGTHGVPWLKKTTDFSCAASLSYGHPRLEGWRFSAEVAADRGPVYGNNAGFALSVRKTGILKRW